MNQATFLSVLRESLEGNIPQAELEENLKYYREIFENGEKSDKEICDELGDPRLIAKSVIEAYLASKGSEAQQYTRQARSEYSRARGGYTSEYGDDTSYKSVLHGITYVIIVIAILLILVALLRLAVLLFVPIVLLVVVWKLVHGD